MNDKAILVASVPDDSFLLDVDALKGMDRVEGICNGYVSPAETKPSVRGVSERPPEHDRYQVYDADFSQQGIMLSADHAENCRLSLGLGIRHVNPSSNLSVTRA